MCGRVCSSPNMQKAGPLVLIDVRAGRGVPVRRGRVSSNWTTVAGSNYVSTLRFLGPGQATRDLSALPPLELADIDVVGLQPVASLLG